MSILTRCIFVLIHLPERFQIDAIPMKTLSELVWTESLNTSNVCVFKRGRRVFIPLALLNFQLIISF